LGAMISGGQRKLLIHIGLFEMKTWIEIHKLCVSKITLVSLLKSKQDDNMIGKKPRSITVTKGKSMQIKRKSIT
jgi:hypothetical protein